MRTAAIALLPLALLAACATPREACINDVSREFNRIGQLIETTRANVDRGYALERVERTRTVDDICRGTTSEGVSFTFDCEKTEVYTVSQRVAIDINAERAKLESLLQRQREMQGMVQSGVQACVAAHPE